VTERPILVVQRGWPQQENPALPLIPADAPAVLAGRTATRTTDVPGATADLVAEVRQRATELGLGVDDQVLHGVVAHALRAGRDAPAVLRLVVADVGDQPLVYALLIPKSLADRGSPT
jgi:hypothetical protein